MKLINADALKQEIKSNADLGQWDIQEVIKIIDNFPEYEYHDGIHLTKEESEYPIDYLLSVDNDD